MRLELKFRGPNLKFFIVRVRVRLISGCDLMFNMSTAVRIKLQTEKCFFYPPSPRTVDENFHFTV